MKYRRLSPTGDYVFGQNSNDMLVDLQACAQAIDTRLSLFQGTFWRDLSDGTPYYQNILGTPGSPANLTVVDTILKNRILGTPNVSQVVDYTSTFSGATRQYSYTSTIQTVFSTTVIEGSF